MEKLNNQILLVMVPKDFDEHFLEEIRADYRANYTTDSIEKVLLNFSSISYLSSSHLSILFSIKIFFNDNDIAIGFVNISKKIENLISEIGIGTILVDEKVKIKESRKTGVFPKRSVGIDLSSVKYGDDKVCMVSDCSNYDQKIIDCWLKEPLKKELCEDCSGSFSVLHKLEVTFQQKKGGHDELNQLNKNLNDELLLQKELYLKVTKGLEEKLEEARTQLMETTEQLHFFDKSNSIGELAAGVAHEFNNIIGGILGFAQLAQLKKTNEMNEKAFSTIIKLSGRAESITTGLLNFSRKKPVKVTLVSIEDIINDVLSFTQKQLENKKIIIEASFEELDKIAGDENLLSQVFLNLVINASHSMDEGGTLRIVLYVEDEMLIAKISDTGSGIKPVNLKKIFQPFFTTKGALGGGNSKGTGLGLSISRNIVKTHGGKLEAESEVGVGSTFIVSLPYSRKGVDEKAAVKEVVVEGNEKIKYKVLIVDDEEVIRDLIGIALVEKGHEVLKASNGIDGVACYKKETPDIVFLDILMPKMNGLDVYLNIRKLNSNAKIIFITGQAGDYLERVLDTLSKKDSFYLIRKPFNIQDILGIIDVAMNKDIE